MRSTYRWHPAVSPVLTGLVLGLATPATGQTPLYDVVDLGPVPGSGMFSGVIAKGISPDGSKVTGTSVWEGYVWDEISGIRALPKPAGEVVISAEAVADSGVVVGYSGLTRASHRALLWDPAGALQSLHQPSWVWSEAQGLDESGSVLMTVALPNGSSGDRHVLLRSPTGGFVDLTPTSTIAYGTALSGSGYALYVTDTAFERRTPSGATDSLGFAFTAHAISESGEVAGIDNGLAARWTRTTGWTSLPSGGLNIRQLGGVDSFGRVGASHTVQTQSSPPRFDHFAHLYTDRLGWLDLNAVVDPAQFLDIELIAGVSDDGRIAAYGSIGPDNRALLLIPRFVTNYGDGCGPNPARASVAGAPIAGERIAFLGGNAPPGASGAIVVGLASIDLPVFGCSLLVDPTSSVAVAVTTDAAGHASLPLPLPLSTSGLTIYSQFAVVDPAAPNGFLSLSNGVQVDVQ